MNRIAIAPLFLVVTATCATAYAQSAPISGTFGAATPSAPAPTSTAPAQIADAGPPSRHDPRVCLEFPTNAQVIACAEKFRAHKRRS